MKVIDEARNEEFKKVQRQENSQNTEISGVSDVRLMDSRRNIAKGKVSHLSKQFESEDEANMKTTKSKQKVKTFPNPTTSIGKEFM